MEDDISRNKQIRKKYCQELDIQTQTILILWNQCKTHATTFPFRWIQDPIFKEIYKVSINEEMENLYKNCPKHKALENLMTTMKNINHTSKIARSYLRAFDDFIWRSRR